MSLLRFQQRVHAWLAETFPGTEVSPAERSRRFLEEAVELVQAVGLSDEDIWSNVERVLSREPGQVRQELGGTMVSLAGLSQALGEDMAYAGEVELARVSDPGMQERMRARHQVKVDAGVAEW